MAVLVRPLFFLLMTAGRWGQYNNLTEWRRGRRKRTQVVSIDAEWNCGSTCWWESSPHPTCPQSLFAKTFVQRFHCVCVCFWRVHWLSKDGNCQGKDPHSWLSKVLLAALISSLFLSRWLELQSLGGHAFQKECQPDSICTPFFSGSLWQLSQNLLNAVKHHFPSSCVNSFQLVMQVKLSMHWVTNNAHPKGDLRDCSGMSSQWSRPSCSSGGRSASWLCTQNLGVHWRTSNVPKCFSPKVWSHVKIWMFAGLFAAELTKCQPKKNWRNTAKVQEWSSLSTLMTVHFFGHWCTHHIRSVCHARYSTFNTKVHQELTLNICVNVRKTSWTGFCGSEHEHDRNWTSWDPLGHGWESASKSEDLHSCLWCRKWTEQCTIASTMKNLDVCHEDGHSVWSSICNALCDFVGDMACWKCGWQFHWCFMKNGLFGRHNLESSLHDVTSAWALTFSLPVNDMIFLALWSCLMWHVQLDLLWQHWLELLKFLFVNCSCHQQTLDIKTKFKGDKAATWKQIIHKKECLWSHRAEVMERNWLFFGEGVHCCSEAVLCAIFVRCHLKKLNLMWNGWTAPACQVQHPVGVSQDTTMETWMRPWKPLPKLSQRNSSNWQMETCIPHENEHDDHFFKGRRNEKNEVGGTVHFSQSARNNEQQGDTTQKGKVGRDESNQQPNSKTEEMKEQSKTPVSSFSQSVTIIKQQGNQPQGKASLPMRWIQFVTLTTSLQGWMRCNLMNPRHRVTPFPTWSLSTAVLHVCISRTTNERMSFASTIF